MKKKTWLITGASSGLGKSLVECVLESDDFVIPTFRKSEQVRDFNKHHGASARAIELDLSDPESIEKAIHILRTEFDQIDVLVNNAGVGFAGGIEESSVQEVRAVFETNFFGMYQLTQGLLPMMRARGEGTVVQISSHAGIKAFPGFGVYNASKFAMEGMSEALEQELKPLGIKLYLVEPGPFRTGFAGKGLMLAEKEIEAYAQTSGAFKQKLQSVDGKQEGDPNKAARAILDLVHTQPDILRMPLGKIPLTTIAMKLDELRNDMDKMRQISESAVFE